MKVVVCAVGTRGDVGPAISVAEAIVATGNEVVLVGSPPFARDAEKRGIRWHEVGWDYQRMLTKLGALKAREAGEYFAQHRSEQLAGEVPVLLDEARDAHVVVGVGAPFAPQTIAEHYGISYRYVALTPTWYRSAEWPDNLVPVSGGRLRHRISWMLADNGGRVVAKDVNGYRAELGLAPLANGYDASYDRGGRPIVAAHAPLLRIPGDVRERFVRCAAIRQPALNELSAETARYLAEGEPPLYVGMGSLQNYKWASSLAAVVEGVERTGRRAIFSGSIWDDMELPQSALRCGAERHDVLFPRVAAVVSHGGAGTVSQAVWAGVPQVVVAMGGDQPYWGRMTVAAGVSPASFSLRRASAHALADALEAAHDNGFAGRARDLAREVADTDGAGEVAAEIAGSV